MGKRGTISSPWLPAHTPRLVLHYSEYPASPCWLMSSPSVS
jgi:hypothetical protein